MPEAVPGAAAAGSVVLGGEVTVHRLGFGAMRLAGQPGNWGPADDPAGAVALLRRAVDLGINLVDTADVYGPGVSEELVAEALHPYPESIVIATKGGVVRTGREDMHPDGSPAYLRTACEASLRRLRTDRIDLYQLHVVDDRVPIEDSVGALADLRSEGKIRFLGVSNVDREQLNRARATTDVVAVQNRYSVAHRDADPVVDACERNGLVFIAYGPLGADPLRPGAPLAARNGPLATIAERHAASPGAVALAWLLQRSPALLPIVGTTSVEHLEANVAASALRLDEADLLELNAPSASA